MKRKVFALTFLFISAYTFVPAALSAQSEIGIIRQMNGTVEIKTANADIFTTAKAGDKITQDTVISTGFRSNAIIEIGSSLIIVRPLTHLTLAQLQIMENEESVNINLQAGRVRVDVKPPSGTKSTLSVQSPSSVASVRGTSFEFDTRN
ncbi:MAG: FecR domain-containing protein, partial [Treponema sp.]|nr:FecR domain-containing protein [Treponema sp.]